MNKNFNFFYIVFFLFLIQTALAEEKKDQILFSGDLIRVDFFEERELLREIEVSGDGCIALPLIGKLHIAGLTIRQAENRIEERYKSEEMLVSPQVNILLLKPAERIILVQGQVNKPGVVLIPHAKTNMSLSEVISAASDLNLRANASSVQVKSTDLEGKKVVYKVNYKKLRSSANAEEIFLKNGDEVFVPESIF